MSRSKSSTGHVVALALCALLVSATSAGAQAQDSIVTVVLAGEAYDGPPAFAVTFNGAVVGQGVVDKAIDTIAKGRIVAHGAMQGPAESFTFRVPSKEFDPHAELRIALTNDKFDEVNKVGDRNLYVVSASVNGREIQGPDFVRRFGDSRSPLPLILGMVPLPRNADLAIAEPPPEGWPSPGREGPGTAAVPPAAGPSAPGSTGSAASTGTPSASEPPPKCAVNLVVTIAGFAQNVADLNAGQRQQLVQLADTLKGQDCAVVSTGYGDMAGPKEFSRQIAGARASTVVEFLKARGAHFSRVDVVPFGATRQFGPSNDLNRRVVVSIGP